MEAFGEHGDTETQVGPRRPGVVIDYTIDGDRPEVDPEDPTEQEIPEYGPGPDVGIRIPTREEDPDIDPEDESITVIIPPDESPPDLPNPPAHWEYPPRIGEA